MPLSSVQVFSNNVPFLSAVNPVRLSIFISLFIVVATLRSHSVPGCSIAYRRDATRRRRKRDARSGDSELLFFFHLSASLSDRSRKVGAKNRQLPNERQLSGDQLQEGPDRRIRCNRPMSTVQHLCPFSVSFSSPAAVQLLSQREGKGNAEERKEARVVFVSFAGRGIRTKAVPEIAGLPNGMEWSCRVGHESIGKIIEMYARYCNFSDDSLRSSNSDFKKTNLYRGNDLILEINKKKKIRLKEMRSERSSWIRRRDFDFILFFFFLEENVQISYLR